MEEEFHIVYREKPAWELVGGGITEFNTEKAGEADERHLCFVVEGPDEEVVGGVIGTTYWGWFYLSLLWIRADFRGRGFGAQLLASAEQEARLCGVKHVYLDTFSFQAPGFYKKFGYEVFGELADFPPGHQRYFMRKDL